MNEAQIEVYKTVSSLLSQKEHKQREIQRHCDDIEALNNDAIHLDIAYDMAVAKFEELGDI